MKRRGSADLPLHHGTVPPWLADRMRDLGLAITEALLLEGGRRAFLERLSDPAWFQALGAVMGMDWHSSGITTSVMRALQRGLNPRASELGIYVLGGRGRYSRKTPDELKETASKEGLDGESLGETSRLVARIDNNCLQDGFQIYLHNFVVTREGDWAVVQQGMKKNSAMARRYHWNSLHTPHPSNGDDTLRDSWYFNDPRQAVSGEPSREYLINLSDTQARANRKGILSFTAEHPDLQQKELMSLLRCRRITLPGHHEVRPEDIITPRLGALLAAAWEQPYRDFTQTLLLPGMGPRSVQALALISEIIYGAPSRFSDPARFAFAHGGKDGHPHPVLTRTYDQSLAALRSALNQAHLPPSERLKSFQSLDQLTRWIEKTQSPDADVNPLIRHERKQAPQYGGRTVFDGPPRQGELF